MVTSLGKRQCKPNLCQELVFAMLVVLLTKSTDIYGTGNIIQSTFFFSVTDNQTSDVEHQLLIKYCGIIGNLGPKYLWIVFIPHC